MSKIALFDSNSQKFTGDMTRWWEDHGHEVRYEYGYNPELAKESDIVWIDVCDYNAEVATTGGHIGPDWIIPDGKKLVVRAIDIEVWTGLHTKVSWDKVSDVVFIAKHIEEVARKDIDFEARGVKVHLIPCGVDTARFTPKTYQSTKKIAVVAEMWHAKGIDMMLEIAYALPRQYQINVLGRWAGENWFKDWIDYMIKQHNLNVTFEEWTDDMNQWLEDKEFVMTCSRKEAFSYAIAEGMIKGIKPIVHDFHGSRDIWRPEDIFVTAHEAVQKITSGYYTPDQYRSWIFERGYTLEAMMQRIDEFVLADRAL